MATVPAVHPDVTAVLPDGVVLAAPLDGASGADAWLSVEHLREHAATIDVLHLHVGRHHLRSVGSPEQVSTRPLVSSVRSVIGDLPW